MFKYILLESNLIKREKYGALNLTSTHYPQIVGTTGLRDNKARSVQFRVIRNQKVITILFRIYTYTKLSH